MKRNKLNDPNVLFEDLYNRATSKANSGDKAQQQRNFEKAIEFYNTAINLYGQANRFYQSNEISVKAAEIYFEAGKLSKMIGNYEDALENYNNSAEIIKGFSYHLPGFGGALGKVQQEIKNTQTEQAALSMCELHSNQGFVKGDGEEDVKMAGDSDSDSDSLAASGN